MGRSAMKAQRSCRRLLTAGACTGIGIWLALSLGIDRAAAHKEAHSLDDLKAFEDIFMKQVETGDLLFHGDAETQERLGVQLSNTGMACAMCHPFASDTHPHEFPKWQEPLREVATLRDVQKGRASCRERMWKYGELEGG